MIVRRSQQVLALALSRDATATDGEDGGDDLIVLVRKPLPAELRSPVTRVRCLLLRRILAAR